MSTPRLNSLAARWATFAPYLQSLLRIVAAFMLTLAGSMKLLGFPARTPMPIALGSQIGVGAVLEIAGGILLMLGLFTRPVAFLLAGQMAVAYLQFHAVKGFWPVMNGGVAAALYCFIWLYISAAGPGPLSVDARRAR